MTEVYEIEKYGLKFKVVGCFKSDIITDNVNICQRINKDVRMAMLKEEIETNKSLYSFVQQYHITAPSTMYLFVWNNTDNKIFKDYCKTISHCNMFKYRFPDEIPLDEFNEKFNDY